MGRNDNGELGGICGYAKMKYEERVEERWKKSQSEHKRSTSPVGKLYKPQETQRLQVRTPRNRLRKSMIMSSPPGSNPPSKSNILFILQFDPYPHDTDPRRFLGVYSSIDYVTLGAVEHGAYSFSREGLVDGSEYLSSNGRIKIIALPIVNSGVKVNIPERSQTANGELIRLDIPHPTSTKDADNQHELKEDEDSKMRVFLAVRMASNNASCIGVYSEKSLAWGACLKDKSMCASTHTLGKETRSIGRQNMPSVTATLGDIGRHTWSVEGFLVNSY